MCACSIVVWRAAATNRPHLTEIHRVADPYYADEFVTLYCGDAVRHLFDDDGSLADAVIVTDPPYGISYHTNSARKPGNARKIKGDKTTQLRDFLLLWADEDQPALIFGSPRVPKPEAAKGTLVWDKGGALGMGDLSLPWKFDHEEIYVLGRGFVGSRDSGSVLRFPPVQSMGRDHPHEKPVELMTSLIVKCPADRVILDPFAGSGTTLVAAKRLGRRAVGIELEERWCEIAAQRCSQGVLGVAA
jgi:DNA modification methylase